MANQLLTTALTWGIAGSLGLLVLGAYMDCYPEPEQLRAALATN